MAGQQPRNNQAASPAHNPFDPLRIAADLPLVSPPFLSHHHVSLRLPLDSTPLWQALAPPFIHACVAAADAVDSRLHSDGPRLHCASAAAALIITPPLTPPV